MCRYGYILIRWHSCCIFRPHNKWNRCVSLQCVWTHAASLCNISLLYCLDPSHREQSIRTHWFCLVFISACKWLPINNSCQIYLISFKGKVQGVPCLTGLAGEHRRRWNVALSRTDLRLLYCVSLKGNSLSGCQYVQGCQPMDFTLWRLIHGHAPRLILVCVGVYAYVCVLAFLILQSPFVQQILTLWGAVFGLGVRPMTN